jgi:group I intron endonuclease
LKHKHKYKNIQPYKVYDNIDDIETINCIKIELKKSRGIYGFLCKINSKIYIGSSENLVNRFLEHLKGKKSNLKLQRAILKYGLNNFYYIIFELHNSNTKGILVTTETLFLSYFKLKYLYNFKIVATSLLGYKHSKRAIEKMKDRFKKGKHPLLGKHHSSFSKIKISLATKGVNNPMYGKRHNDNTKKLMSSLKSKPVYLYKFFNNNEFKLVKVYPNCIEIAKLLNLHKTTIGRYIKNKKVFFWKSNKYKVSRILISDYFFDR